jgi:hypothetical protein
MRRVYINNQGSCCGSRAPLRIIIIVVIIIQIFFASSRRLFTTTPTPYKVFIAFYSGKKLG